MDDFDLETANRRLRESVATMHNQIKAANELAWRLRSYAVHDDNCKINRPPHFRDCSCGLRKLLASMEEQSKPET